MTNMIDLMINEMRVLHADGVDFMPIFSDEVLQSMTREELINAPVIPKTSRKYWKIVNGKKEYLSQVNLGNGINFKDYIMDRDYDFLRTDPHLGDSIILLGLGGSYAYGTNKTDGTSDVDIRGIATNSKDEILSGQDFEQVVDETTDTTIYSVRKIIKLLSDCNPNTIEILGLDDYIYLNDIGQMLLDNSYLFLSQKAFSSFCGYASSQLRRLDNKSARLLKDEEHMMHVLKSVESAKFSFPEKYFYYPQDSINLYVDKAVNKDMASEIFMDINLTHYPLEDWKDMWSEMHAIVKDYKKLGKRNAKAIAHDKLGKHAMHLVRLYLMCLDILNDGKIVTNRTKEHDLLMDIRNGKYLDENRQPTKEFFDIVTYYENEIKKAKEHTSLPEFPDYQKINKLLYDINEIVIYGGKNQ